MSGGFELCKPCFLSYNSTAIDGDRLRPFAFSIHLRRDHFCDWFTSWIVIIVSSVVLLGATYTGALQDLPPDQILSLSYATTDFT